MVYLGKSVEREMHLRAKPELFKFAQAMRKDPTESEKNLWKILRKFRTEGYILEDNILLIFSLPISTVINLNSLSKLMEIYMIVNRPESMMMVEPQNLKNME